jgi:hypothetical protein
MRSLQLNLVDTWRLFTVLAAISKFFLLLF